MSRRRHRVKQKKTFAPKIFAFMFLFSLSTFILSILAFASWYACSIFLVNMPMIKYGILAFFGCYLLSLFFTYANEKYEQYTSVYIANCIDSAMVNLIQCGFFFALVIGYMVWYYLR